MISKVEVYIFSCHKKHNITLSKLEVPRTQAIGLSRAIEEIFGCEDMIGIPMLSRNNVRYTAIVSARRKRPYNLLFLFKCGPDSDVPFLPFDDADEDAVEYVAKNMMDGRIEIRQCKLL